MSLRKLVNIGKSTEKRLNQIGIFTKEDFLSLDPYEVFFELQAKIDPGMCRCALGLIIGAHVGLPWHVVRDKATKEFDKRYPEHRWANCRC